jgi:hypothetical protein
MFSLIFVELGSRFVAEPFFEILEISGYKVGQQLVIIFVYQRH